MFNFIRKYQKPILRPSLSYLEGQCNLVGVEIGVFRGAHTETILDGLHIKRIYLIDPYFPTSRIFQTVGSNSSEIRNFAHAYLQKFSDKLVWFEETSETAAPKIKEDLDFVYIDGDHKYTGVMLDIKSFYDKVKFGGVIAGHDFDEESEGNQVQRAVCDFFNPLNKKVFCDLDPMDSRTHDWWVFK